MRLMAFVVQSTGIPVTGTAAFDAIALLEAVAFIRTAVAPGSPGKRGHMPCASALRLGDAILPPCASYIQ